MASNKTLQPPSRAPRWLKTDRICSHGLRLNVKALAGPKDA